MRPGRNRKFGRVDLSVTSFGFGTAPVGNIFREIEGPTSDAMYQSSWDAGVRYFDTAPMYGHSLAERRTGQSLRCKSRDDYVLSSKVGRALKPAPRDMIKFAPWVNAAAFTMDFDDSHDGTMRALEDSLQRLGMAHMDICFIHGIDVFIRGKDQPEVFRHAMDGCYKALDKMRSEGMPKAIGVGVNEGELCHEALKQRDFDGFLLAGRYTLQEQDALNNLLPICEKRGAAVVVGGGFNSGILATGAKPEAKYNYSPAPQPIMDKVAAIEAVCANHNVPLPTAALQFVVAHPGIASFITRTRTVEQLTQNLGWFSHPIPGALRSDFKAKGLLRKGALVPA